MNKKDKDKYIKQLQDTIKATDKYNDDLLKKLNKSIEENSALKINSVEQARKIGELINELAYSRKDLKELKEANRKPQTGDIWTTKVDEDKVLILEIYENGIIEILYKTEQLGGAGWSSSTLDSSELKKCIYKGDERGITNICDGDGGYCNEEFLATYQDFIKKLKEDLK